MHDLLFLSPIDMNNYMLKYWNHMTGQTEVLITGDGGDLFSGQTTAATPSRIVQYSLTADDRKLAVVRVKEKAQGAVPAEEYELALFDLSTHQITSLAKFESLVRWASISPDGQWVTYILPAATPTSRAGHVAGLAISSQYSMGDSSPGVIFALQTHAPDQKAKISECDEECWSLSWSPDSHTIVWNGRQGVWLASVGGTPARLIAPGKMVVVTNGRSGIYAPPAWSPDGRYLLARSRDFEVDEWGIVDTQTGHFGRLPNSHEYPRPNVHSVWLSDGRLFVVRSGEPNANLAPSGEMWTIDPENVALLTLDKSFVIPVAPEIYPASPVQFDDGRLAFALLAPSGTTHDAESGLYVVNPSDYTPRRVSEPLPASFDVATVLASWSPDGMVALIHSETGPIQRFYVPVNGIVLSSMPQLLGNGSACCFTWLK